MEHTIEEYKMLEKNYREFARAILKQAKYDYDIDFFNSEWGKTIRALAGANYLRNVSLQELRACKTKHYKDITSEELDRITEFHVKGMLKSEIMKKLHMSHGKIATAYEILGFSQDEREKKEVKDLEPEVKDLEPLSRKFLTKKELADYVGVPEIQFADFFSDLLTKGYKFDVFKKGNNNTYRIYK